MQQRRYSCACVCPQAPGLRQLNVVQDQDQQQLMGSPRINRDELSGGFILAPGSETTAAVSEPLADIAGGKSGTEAEIENPYDSMPTAGANHAPADAGHAGVDAAFAAQQSRQDADAQPTGPGVAEAHTVGQDRQQEQTAAEGNDAENSEYSERQQSQQASSACKQS